MWIVKDVSVQEIVEQLEALPPNERMEVLKKTLVRLWPKDGKVIDRLLRRLGNPDIPEDVWRGIEDTEDGRLVDMESALTQKPPWVA